MSAMQTQRDAERDLRTLRGQVDPLLQTVTPTTYLALQKMSDERAGHYVNDMVEQGDDIVRSICGGAKYGRLGNLKRTDDPDNVFRMNQNIRP